MTEHGLVLQTEENDDSQLTLLLSYMALYGLKSTYANYQLLVLVAESKDSRKKIIEVPLGIEAKKTKEVIEFIKKVLSSQRNSTREFIRL